MKKTLLLSIMVATSVLLASCSPKVSESKIDKVQQEVVAVAEQPKITETIKIETPAETPKETTQTAPAPKPTTKAPTTTTSSKTSGSIGTTTTTKPATSTSTPSSNLPTVDLNKPSGFNNALADQLTSVAFQVRSPYVKASGFYQINDTDRYVENYLQSFIKAEAKGESTNMSQGYTWNKDDNTRFEIYKLSKFTFVTDQDSASGIATVMKANTEFLTLDKINQGTICVYYDSAKKKNIVKVYLYCYSWSQKMIQ